MTDQERIEKLEEQVAALCSGIASLTYGVALRSIISFEENKAIVDILDKALPEPKEVHHDIH